ncbi:hypothetical protein A1O7_06858 [Cladophialophora yegresii CBS 114405]|uniref:A-kinase anchor protein 7-like phosphoesterase domain-containing protein n=1 Tax=Cladophialophora yegresii CBS 114405 TaxID=1182544 RepID=W9WDB0_9EURO|nr:uncharacterized protein A1O7_06858 [Cladophialophora yegresii CBS 114405]EXJ56514.1 hypothetical protein A1O7_06858 [Cladophialophora yegresii CBS 114405]
MASATGQPSNSKKPKAKPQGKHSPPTHFLCFPLATDESVRQLTESLAHFRSVTTPLPHPDPDATPEPEDQQGSTTTVAEPDVEGQKLRLLPESAHRPPGTYHLTLGTMNLSKQEDMENAVALLQQINYLALLKDAESGDGIMRHARERARGRGRLPATPSNNADTKSETKSVLEDSHDRENGRGIPQRQPEQHNTLSDPETPEGSQDKPLDDSEMTKDGVSSSSSLSQPRALKSLTRPISPPPIAALSTSTTSSVSPLSISLHSLGVFPKQTAARVFFAHPHDPTNRLQTFGQLIRRHFREAGLITETRPLVLHATVANLIYVRGKDRRGGGGGGGGKGKSANRKSRAGDQDGTVDATGLLRFFNGENDTRGRHGQGGEYAGVVSQSVALDTSAREKIQEAQGLESDSFVTLHAQGEHNRGHDHDHDHSHATPYVWARDIPITCVRVCKMGAEPSTIPGWGLEYRAVAERVFLPEAMRERSREHGPRVGD